MLTYTGIRRYYKLEFTTKKGEKIEVDITSGLDYHPVEDYFREITLISIFSAKYKDYVDKELEPDDKGFDEYEEEIWYQFDKQYEATLKVYVILAHPDLSSCIVNAVYRNKEKAEEWVAKENKKLGKGSYWVEQSQLIK